MGFPEPNERFTRANALIEAAVNTKEDEALINELFIGNHFFEQRHTQRILKLISMLEAV
jgi:tRNA isopentenyl-2-thiomethyl-A-37 hydroxylase MiaE